MLNRFNKHTAAASLAVCLAGFLSAPVGAACYFGECTTGAASSTAPTTIGSGVSVSPPAASEKPSRIVATHGGWSGLVKGGMAFIVDDFTDGSHFVIVPYSNDLISFRLSNPQWHLKPGQKFEVKADIDGHIFSGTGVANSENVIEIENVAKNPLDAFYRGREAKITIENDVFNLSPLPDAAQTIDDVKTYLESASL